MFLIARKYKKRIYHFGAVTFILPLQAITSIPPHNYGYVKYVQVSFCFPFCFVIYPELQLLDALGILFAIVLTIIIY